MTDYSVIEQNELEIMLQKQFPTQLSACSEIINLKAILDLPKPTEHFLSDLHGEHDAFMHMLKNGSGLIKNKIQQEFGNSLSPCEKDKLTICVVYPEETIKKMKETINNINEWYLVTIQRLIRICRVVSRKYTRSKVRKALPEEYKYVIEELLHETDHGGNKIEYYDAIIKNIVKVGTAETFIISICEVIQRLAIDKLHIVGDIFDRGPGPHHILDELIKHHSVDIQWGNHDIVWMGAACGSPVCIACVIRICARYGYINIIEDGYGINLRPLATLASSIYADDECDCFKIVMHGNLDYDEKMLLRRMHKAIAIIQFKLEGQLIMNNPLYEMENRLLLDKIKKDRMKICIDDKEYDLNDNNFPTIDLEDPYRLDEMEVELIERLKKSFLFNEKLNKHVSFLLKKGSMYLRYNSNLLLHGCIPMQENGEFAIVPFLGEEVKGKSAMDAFDKAVRKSYYNREKQDNNTDVFWYLWSGPNSPLFGKTEMKTFERYFISDKDTHVEKENPYYLYWEDENKCDEILKEFKIRSEFSHIINGHVPVRVKEGESPIKANGKLIVIDGGLNPVYYPVTGTAGYTLIYNSYELILAAHQKFTSMEEIINNSEDIMSFLTVCDRKEVRIRVKDTDVGKKILLEIQSLEKLLKAYLQGRIKEE